ncbi:hypothetical protein HR45_14850 [Shewanella mangrovi]|uniref:Uncharacterized protein n=1 Tax=Shewanella mangrovi TaxID=1515746 RepID=A0A094LNM2_9GAMM|nr:hypothetical protein [Shewanella mangrovi]KFZ36728.1 hypothetical protein HR45_14850 [Shewanella mangrovi]
MTTKFTVEQSMREHTTAERIIWCAANDECDYVVMKDDEEVHFTHFSEPGRLKLLRAAAPINSAEALLSFAEHDYAERVQALYQ